MDGRKYTDVKGEVGPSRKGLTSLSHRGAVGRVFNDGKDRQTEGWTRA